MPYPRKYDYNLILSLWREGKTTSEIAALACPDKRRGGKFIGAILRDKFGIDVQAANRREFFGKNRAYPADEKELWKRLRPYKSVQAIVNERRAAGVKLTYAAVHRVCIDINGPREFPVMGSQQRLEAKRLYQTYGWHVMDLVLRFGFAHTTIRKYIGETDGYHLPPRKRQPNYLITAPMADIAKACLPRKAA